MSPTEGARHLRAVGPGHAPAPGDALAALGRILVHAVDHHVTAAPEGRTKRTPMLRALQSSGRLLALAMMAPSGRSGKILAPWLSVTAHAAAPQLRRELQRLVRTGGRLDPVG